MKFKIAVFPRKSYKTKNTIVCNAYTMWYNPSWRGCNIVEVEASDGNEAKKRAIEIIKLRFKTNPDEVKLVHD